MKKLILTLLLAIVCVPAWASPWDAPNSFEIVKESSWDYRIARTPVSYTHLRAHET